MSFANSEALCIHAEPSPMLNQISTTIMVSLDSLANISRNQTTTAATKRASTRLSTFSVTPTLAPSIAPSHLSTESSLSPSEKQSPLAQDMSALHDTLQRLEEPRLTNQRYVASEGKKEEISKLALGAKLERALGRRMSSQDASFTKKKEVSGLKGQSVKEVKATAA